jgi:large conductance mechanosensitive channel
MLKEFKAFVFRGNVLDLAIATIIGATFNSIVSSIIDNIFMPIIGVMMGGKNFEKLVITIGEAEIKYGLTLAAIVKFLVVALFLFIVIKAVNKFRAKEEEAPAPPAEDSKTDKLLAEILEQLKKN